MARATRIGEVEGADVEDVGARVALQEAADTTPRGGGGRKIRPIDNLSKGTAICRMTLFFYPHSCDVC